MNSRVRKAGESAAPSKGETRALALAWRCGLAVLLLTTGCQQEMAHQPHYRPLEDSQVFADGSSARPLEEGTVARGYLRADDLLHTGTQTRDGKEELAAEFPFAIT